MLSSQRRPGLGAEPILATDACPQAAIVINHLDPNSSYGLGGDRYHLSVDGGVGPT